MNFRLGDHRFVLYGPFQGGRCQSQDHGDQFLCVEVVLGERHIGDIQDAPDLTSRSDGESHDVMSPIHLAEVFVLSQHLYGKHGVVAQYPSLDAVLHRDDSGPGAVFIPAAAHHQVQVFGFRMHLPDRDFRRAGEALHRAKNRLQRFVQIQRIELLDLRVQRRDRVLLPGDSLLELLVDRLENPFLLEKPSFLAGEKPYPLFRLGQPAGLGIPDQSKDIRGYEGGGHRYRGDAPKVDPVGQTPGSGLEKVYDKGEG